LSSSFVKTGGKIFVSDHSLDSLLFAGAVMGWLAKDFFALGFTAEAAKLLALGYSLIISLFTAVALMLLFFLAKKDRFYPAMPFISVGCFLGLLVVWIL